MKGPQRFLLSALWVVVLGSASALATGSRDIVFWHDQIQWGASQAEARRVVATNQDLTFSCFRLNPAAVPEATGCMVKQRGAAPDALKDEAFLMFYQDRFFRYELFFSNSRFFSISDLAERQLGRPARSTAFAVEGTRGKYTTHVKLWEPRRMKVFMLRGCHNSSCPNTTWCVRQRRLGPITVRNESCS